MIEPKWICRRCNKRIPAKRSAWAISRHQVPSFCSDTCALRFHSWCSARRLRNGERRRWYTEEHKSVGKRRRRHLRAVA